MERNIAITFRTQFLSDGKCKQKLHFRRKLAKNGFCAMRKLKNVHFCAIIHFIC